ncbi:PREDICTED: chaperone protein dnaJ 11, chloroplastic-like [Ipomoea nil]|uniref:chaperone protein dnaJ 11, chloroplastic-like n=1 Tax=Ipomoea nil TaxID=35883 RepID=UPI00090176E7|nr:PREDICTED: chaperone protein dnaJ 11, chloroplastic-like [Ipomoea nil]
MLHTLNLSASVSSGAVRSSRKMQLEGAKLRRPVISSAMAEAAPAVEMRGPGSLYEVLRVKQNASPREIKAAYRTLAKIYHPDAAARFEEESSSDGHLFMEIQNAYATLSDPESRALYDLKLRVGSRGRNGLSGYSAGSCMTRRWESDQCW